MCINRFPGSRRVRWRWPGVPRDRNFASSELGSDRIAGLFATSELGADRPAGLSVSSEMGPLRFAGVFPDFHAHGTWVQHHLLLWKVVFKPVQGLHRDSSPLPRGLLIDGQLQQGATNFQ
jgi:hypothetical protein